MVGSFENGALLLALLPIIAVVAIGLNLMLRARGGRSFHLQLKAFGIDLKIDTVGESNAEVKDTDT